MPRDPGRGVNLYGFSPGCAGTFGVGPHPSSMSVSRMERAIPGSGSPCPVAVSEPDQQRLFHEYVAVMQLAAAPLLAE